MTGMASPRNAHQWRAIAYFLAGFETLATQGAQRLEGTRVSGKASRREALPSAINFGGCVAPCTTSGPDGNHGDNFAKGTA